MAFELVLPTMPHLQEAVAEGLKAWPVQPRVVIGEQEKRAAFRIAHAALAKSGTVTLELALAGVPMVTAYRTGSMEAWILRRAIKVNSVILANLVIGENVVPEFLQEDCTPEKLAAALREVLGDSALRRKQLEAFAKIDGIMSTGNQPPSVRAADIVLATMRKARRSGLALARLAACLPAIRATGPWDRTTTRRPSARCAASAVGDRRVEAAHPQQARIAGRPCAQLPRPRCAIRSSSRNTAACRGEGFRSCRSRLLAFGPAKPYRAATVVTVENAEPCVLRQVWQWQCDDRSRARRRLR